MNGHIYRKNRSDGTLGNWHAVIDLPRKADGKRRQKTSTYDTRREANAWLARINQELSAGEDYDTTIKVDQYLTEWLAGKQALRPSTRLAYQSHINQHLVPHLGHLKLADLRAHHIEGMYRDIASQNDERQRPIGPVTIRRIHATLMSALTTAHSRGMVRRNPAAYIELEKSRSPRPELWTTRQLIEFLDLIGDDRLYALYSLLALRGLRRGEVVGLRWKDIDFSGRTLSIRQQVVNVRGELTVGEPKSAAGVRTIALDQSTAELLRQHRAHQNSERLRAGPRWNEAGLAFTTAGGDVLDPAYVTKHFNRLVVRHGLPKLRLHDLRHLSATIGLEAGESLKEVSARLGHSSMAFTGDVYAQVTADTAHASAERLAQHLRSGGGS